MASMPAFQAGDESSTLSTRTISLEYIQLCALSNLAYALFLRAFLLHDSSSSERNSIVSFGHEAQARSCEWSYFILRVKYAILITRPGSSAG